MYQVAKRPSKPFCLYPWAHAPCVSASLERSPAFTGHGGERQSRIRLGILWWPATKSTGGALARGGGGAHLRLAEARQRETASFPDT